MPISNIENDRITKLFIAEYMPNSAGDNNLKVKTVNKKAIKASSVFPLNSV
jgi:hypothetical protein